MQVEGRAEIRTLVSGVTASAALIERAEAAGADAILVHHGYFWRGEDPRLTGVKRERIARLLRAGIGLFAYHLPLDAHPEVGNNAQLAARLGVGIERWAGEDGLIALGRLSAPATLGGFAAAVTLAVGRTPQVFGDPGRPVERVGLCTGAAQGHFGQAVDLGVDVYVTGEVSEPQYHLAAESGVGFVAAGHHATEVFGVQALGAHLAARFGLVHRYIDIPNPV